MLTAVNYVGEVWRNNVSNILSRKPNAAEPCRSNNCSNSEAGLLLLDVEFEIRIYF